MVLSNKQREDLHRAILGYLKSTGLESSYEALAKETNLVPEEKHSDMLEKKWTSIIRLQKKIMELEGSSRQLREDLESMGRGHKVDLSACLPRDPARHIMQGHRDGITAVLFHPIYSVLVSSSEDSTIKVWDYETGKFERTLQGHQDAVQDIAFNSTGSMLVSSSADLSIKLWDFDSYECLKTLHGHDHNVSSVRFLPSGDFVLSASRDKTIKLWEVATGYCVRTYSGHDQW
jgi:platelet-activating factor acetylhydrolase IB subunit alpha